MAGYEYRMRLSFWYIKAALSSPAFRRTFLATMMEVIGFGLVLYGLWFISPILFVIGMGGLLLLLSQGISYDRGEE
jgi:uncharacterized membrane protein